MAIEIDLDLSTVRAQVDEMRERLPDMSETWQHVQRDYTDTRRVAFETQGQSIGRPWPGYTQAEAQYVAIKSRLLGRPVTNADLLRWPGDQERVYPSLTDPSHPEHVFVSAEGEMQIGSAVPGVDDIEHGTGRAPAHLGGHTPPARPIAHPLGARFEERLQERLDAHVEAAVTGEPPPMLVSL
jgi:hypothetical protein